MMRTLFNFHVLVALGPLVGFGLILSKYSFLPTIGVVMVLLCFFAPLCEEPLSQLLKERQRAQANEQKKPAE